MHVYLYIYIYILHDYIGGEAPTASGIASVHRRPGRVATAQAASPVIVSLQGPDECYSTGSLSGKSLLCQDLSGAYL